MTGMSVQNINNAIDEKIIETNERTNRSVEIRRNHNDKDMQEKLEKFDKTYLNDEERKQIEELNKAEDKQLKESGKYAIKSVGNTIKVAAGGIIGKTYGAFGATDNAQRFNDSEDKLSAISDTRDAIRAKAQERYEKASGLSSSVKTSEEEQSYGK